LIEDDGDNGEEAEEEQLQPETHEEDFLAKIFLTGLGHHASASGLHEETQHVTDDEDLGDAWRAHDACFGSIDEEDGAPLNHVDFCGV